MLDERERVAGDSVHGVENNQEYYIIGSKAAGETVVAEVGGDLNLISLQDTEEYKAKNKNSGLGVSTGVNGGVTGSVSQGKTDSTYQSVTDQAGIYAGEGGFDIEVGGNTDLKGAVIASEADADKNRLSTDTLTYSDIENKAEYSSSSVGINLDTKKDAEKKDAGLTPNIGVSASGDAGSTTQSAIAPGTIEVRSNPEQDLSKLNRDPSEALNALGQIFDKKTVQERQELAKVFGEVAYEVVGEIARNHQREAAQKNFEAALLEKIDPDNPQIAVLRQEANAILTEWGQGGTNKIALHALVGGVMSSLSGNGFDAGAAAAGINEALQKGLGAWEEKNPAANQWASIVIGAAVDGMTGSNSNAGASAALSGTKYNADVPRLFLGAVGAVIPDKWIDDVFNPGLKVLFKKIGTDGLTPNQYKAFAIDFGEGVQIKAGYLIDGTGNVYEVTGMGAGASVLPVSFGGTIGIVLKQDGYGYKAEDMQNAMQGYSVGFSFQGGTQGGLAWSPASNVVTAEVGGVANAGVGVMGIKVNYLFNINDN